MKNRLKSATVVMAFLTVAGCAPSPELIASKSVPTSFAVQQFSDLCLSTLPEFEPFAEAGQRSPLHSVYASGLDESFQYADKALVVGTVALNGQKVCGVGFVTTEDPQSIGTSVLDAATARTGGQPRAKVPSSRYHYVYHLKNGSLLTYEIRRRSGYLRHMIAVSHPVSEGRIALYLN